MERLTMMYNITARLGSPTATGSNGIWTSESISDPSVYAHYGWLITLSMFFATILYQIGFYFFFHDAPPKGLKAIPGPRSTIPWLGRVHDVDVNAPWYAWTKFTSMYGGWCASTICGEMHVWIGDAQVAYDLLCKKAKIYSSRPEVPAVPGSDSQGQYLPLLAHGEHWRRQRKFAHTVLAQAQSVKYYGYVTHEAKWFLYKLLENPTDHYTLTDRFCGRISARLGYGSPDSGAAHCKNAGEFIPQISPSGPPTNLLPLLGKLPEWLNPSIKAVRLRREREEKLWRGLMDQVRQDMKTGKAPVSYARTYLERKEADVDSRPFDFDDEEAIYAVGMLVTVAIFTIGGPLYCFLLAMVLYPEWQTKVRAEVDRVAGDRIVEMTDSPNLPILRACIKECIRWRPPVPLGVPRLLEENDEYNGYFLPKGAIVHAIDLALARNETLYPDPEAYLPSRWLEPSYPTYKQPLSEYPKLMGHHGFGMGRRMCPGIELTEAELLVACGSIIGAFELKPIKDSTGRDVLPDSFAFSPNLIGGPLPFKMDVQVRSKLVAERIRKDYQDSFLVEDVIGRDGH